MTVTVDLTGLDSLVQSLLRRGWSVLGPTVRDGAVVHDEITGVADLPRGVVDEQAPGRYRLQAGVGEALFGHVVGPQSAKSVLFPSRRLLWRGRRTDDGFSAEPGGDDPGEVPRLALLGIRSCDLHAIAISDRVLGSRQFADGDYLARRDRLFLVAVDCAHPGGTCFCASTGTGPRADSGFDLALTELLDDDGHRFLVRSGSDAGAELLAELEAAEASGADLAAADAQAEEAAASMGRRMPTEGLRDLLYANVEHPRWDDVASRCLSCGNCTQVCPTCFCTTVEDVTDLAAEAAERWRVWDSCFTEDFSYLHGGSVRPTTRSRYRQWMTHKLASWHDQFGSSGCVGCGRCLTWCPVGIDITAEVAAIRADPLPAAPPAVPPGRTAP
jgi:ferredoxin